MKDTERQVGWGFWLLWVVASTVGMFVGLILTFFLYSVYYAGLGFESSFAYDMLATGFGIGIGVGISQWLVLRRRVSHVGWWVLANTAAGFAIMLAGFAGYSEPLKSFSEFLSFTGVIVLGGAVTGIFQWLILRRKVSKAGWWVLASTLGWGLGVTVARAFPWGIDNYGIGPLAVTAAVLGAITGGVLVWLLRQPKLED